MRLPILATLATLPLAAPLPARAQTALPNVSYDPARELYAAIDPAFAAAQIYKPGF